MENQFDSQEFEAELLTGLIKGIAHRKRILARRGFWLHRSMAWTLRFRNGEGRIIILKFVKINSNKY